MKWIAKGLDASGATIERTVSAYSADEARESAKASGMFCQDVQPADKAAPMPVLPPALPLQPAGPTFICPNQMCGFSGAAIVEQKGDAFIGVLLLFLAIIPGVAYFMFCCGTQYRCPKCRNLAKL